MKKLLTLLTIILSLDCIAQVGVDSLYKPSTLAQKAKNLRTFNGLQIEDTCMVNGASILNNSVTISSFTSAGTLILREDSMGVNTTTIKGADSLVGNIVFTLPNTDGNANQFLQSDGSGNLTWATALTGITGSDTRVLFFDGANNPAGDAGLTYNKTTDALSVVGAVTGATFNTLTLSGTDNISVGASNALASLSNTIVFGKTINQTDENATNTVAVGHTLTDNGNTGNNILLGQSLSTSFNGTILIGSNLTASDDGQTIIQCDDNIYFGNGAVSASPDNPTINAPGGSGTNIPGATLSIAGGKGTGTGTPGVVNIQTSTLEASGTTLQTLGTVARFDASTTATQTRFLIYDVDNGTLERVTVGAADSGGAGFEVLRIPN